MFEIRDVKQLAPKIRWMEIEAPRIARYAEAGQFVVLRIHEKGERIPLTIFKKDADAGTIQLVFQEVGKTTLELGQQQSGDSLMDLVGPLGTPTRLDDYGTVVVVSGGVGTPIAYAVAAAMQEKDNHVVGIAGYRNKDMVILEDDLEAACDELIVTTDDGSYKREGFTTTILQEEIKNGRDIDFVFTVGPVIMMKLVADITREHGIKTEASLNPIMVDGTGMCGACRVCTCNGVQFACVDGPDFDAHDVDFDELLSRLDEYNEEEREALERYREQQEAS
ncbi:MAG: sulfide/dihydroorotate dehydrogenase-like FAD/NAD-binding protein [Thermoplasmatota archaeon]